MMFSVALINSSLVNYRIHKKKKLVCSWYFIDALYNILYICYPLLNEKCLKSYSLTSLRSFTIRISITVGTAVLQIIIVRWLHHHYHICGHSCSQSWRGTLYLTQFLSSDIRVAASVIGFTHVRPFEIYKSLYNITAEKWLISALR